MASCRNYQRVECEQQKVGQGNRRIRSPQSAGYGWFGQEGQGTLSPQRRRTLTGYSDTLISQAIVLFGLAWTPEKQAEIRRHCPGIDIISCYGQLWKVVWMWFRWRVLPTYLVRMTWLIGLFLQALYKRERIGAPAWSYDVQIKAMISTTSTISCAIWSQAQVGLVWHCAATGLDDRSKSRRTRGLWLTSSSYTSMAQ